MLYRQTVLIRIKNLKYVNHNVRITIPDQKIEKSLSILKLKIRKNVSAVTYFCFLMKFDKNACVACLICNGTPKIIEPRKN